MYEGAGWTPVLFAGQLGSAAAAPEDGMGWAGKDQEAPQSWQAPGLVKRYSTHLGWPPGLGGPAAAPTVARWAACTACAAAVETERAGHGKWISGTSSGLQSCMHKFRGCELNSQRQQLGCWGATSGWGTIQARSTAGHSTA